ILAIAPPHVAATVHVRVSTTSGVSSATSADLYTYVDVTRPPPHVANVSNGSGSTGGGQAMYISGTNFSGASGVSFGPSPASSYSVLSDGLIEVVSPAGS